MRQRSLNRKLDAAAVRDDDLQALQLHLCDLQEQLLSTSRKHKSRRNSLMALIHDADIRVAELAAQATRVRQAQADEAEELNRKLDAAAENRGAADEAEELNRKLDAAAENKGAAVEAEELNRKLDAAAGILSL